MKVDCYDDYGAPPLVYRRLTALFRLLYWEPAGLGEAVSVMTSRVPQPRAQADLARARQAHPAGKVPARI